MVDNPWLKCLCPSYAGESFESNFACSEEWKKKLPKFQVLGMADSDFQGETGDVSVGCSYVSINGCPHVFRSFKLPQILSAVTETELYAATECSKDIDSSISLIEEVLITDTNFIDSKLCVDNESELDICYSRGLSKRSRAFRNRELSLRQKITHPCCSVNFSMSKIGREEGLARYRKPDSVNSVGSSISFC